jgi:5-(carboxyamino)imidazole ribonucleotide synthase
LKRLFPSGLEISVVAARGVDGGFASYGAIENIHRNHILDISIAPARVPMAVSAQPWI